MRRAAVLWLVFPLASLAGSFPADPVPASSAVSWVPVGPPPAVVLPAGSDRFRPSFPADPVPASSAVSWVPVGPPPAVVLPAGSDRFRPSFPSAVPSDRGRLEELERRVAELERRLDSPNPARYRETWANPPGPFGGHQ